jgi:peptidoglycan/LPS O-acetylase OafA/YrhL
MVSISNSVLSTWIVGLVLVSCLIVSARPRKPGPLFSPAVTTELKGAAILMIVFAHIGYYLASDPRFLWPLSIMAGVGVNLFLFLSAYGLSLSHNKKRLSIWQWYRKRLPKIYLSLWIVVSTFLVMDYFILSRHYSFQYIWHSMLGFFPRADVYQDLDSVLWYLTFLLFYYLLFPLVYFKKRLWLSAILLFVSGEVFIHWVPLVSPDVLKLYKIHSLAFPLGVLAAWAFSTAVANRARQYLAAKSCVDSLFAGAFRYLFIFALIVTIGYLAVHSGVGQSPHKEQFLSLCTMALIILLFAIKRIEFRFLSLFGLFSYEIYLLHWPLLSRYDIFYRHLNAALATFMWLGVFMMLGWFLSTISGNFKRNVKVK